MNITHASVGATGRELDNVNAELGNKMGFSRRMKGFSCLSSLRCFWTTEVEASGLLASAPLLLMRSSIFWESKQTQK